MPRVIEHPEYGLFEYISAGMLCQGILKLTAPRRKHCRYGQEFCISTPDNWTSSLRYYLAMEHVFSVTGFCALNIMSVGELLLTFIYLSGPTLSYDVAYRTVRS
jgi:hypothetical protein